MDILPPVHAYRMLMCADVQGRIKVLVAASELEFSLAQSLLLDDVVREDQVQQAFRSLDVDGSGTIDVAELKQEHAASYMQMYYYIKDVKITKM